MISDKPLAGIWWNSQLWCSRRQK